MTGRLNSREDVDKRLGSFWCFLRAPRETVDVLKQRLSDRVGIRHVAVVNEGDCVDPPSLFTDKPLDSGS